MKILFKKPSEPSVFSYIQSVFSDPLSYSEQKNTQSTSFPSGYFHDVNKIELGFGKQTFERAKTAIENLEHFPSTWVEPFYLDHSKSPLYIDNIICSRAKLFRFYFLMPCRILHLINIEDESLTRFGFTYGTLQDHPESGEESFEIIWNHSTDQVDYKISAFSKPNHFLTWAGLPLVRVLQKKFVKDSFKKMLSTP